MTFADGDEGPGLPPLGVPVPPKKKRSHVWIWLVILSSVGFVFLFILGFLASFSPKQSILSAKHIGVLELTGVIMDGKEFIENLEEFVEKSNISAIVVRIDSPGGVIAPSQEIFNALLKARKDKKIFASMGTVAASGGYYIAAAANTIVANPGTITGSIGVVMNLSNYEELQRWAKIKSYNIKSGKFKDMGSPTRMITEEERTIFQDMIDSMLGQFVDDIARGRGDKMEKEKIRKLADGRIFTGKDAQELGLVDELGGLNETIELAAKAVGIKGKPKLVYPKEKKKDFINYLLESMIQETLAQILHSQPFHPSATNPPAMGVFPYFYYLYGASTPSNL